MRILLASMTMLTAAGCHLTADCTDELRLGLSVIVSKAGTRVCDATIVARDGDYAETLTPLGRGATCSYYGAAERSGRYTLTVTSGTDMKTLTVLVHEDGCHVKSTSVNVEL